MPWLFMIVTCVILYSMSLWHWAMTIHHLFELGSFSSGLISGRMDCPNALISAPSCSPSFEQMVQNSDPLNFLSEHDVLDCITITPLLINVSALCFHSKLLKAFIYFLDRLFLAMPWYCGEHWSCGHGTGPYKSYQRCCYYRL